MKKYFLMIDPAVAGMAGAHNIESQMPALMQAVSDFLNSGGLVFALPFGVRIIEVEPPLIALPTERNSAFLKLYSEGRDAG